MKSLTKYQVAAGALKLPRWVRLKMLVTPLA